MEYLYFLGNASRILRVVKYLHQMPHLPVKSMTVIHLKEGWVILVELKSRLNPQQCGDFRAFLNELGISYQPLKHVKLALASLKAGQSPIDVMRRYQVIVVSHGAPDCSKIETFCHQFSEGLGYYPETLI